MQDIIRWLRKVECSAGEVYAEAAASYAGEGAFSGFLGRLAEEESWHYHVLGNALAYLAEVDSIEPDISVDEETGARILGYFEDMKEKLLSGTLSRRALVEKIVEAELSEWNDIFLYVVNTLKEQTSEFTYPATRIQAHVKGIEHYLRDVEKSLAVMEKIRTLPPIWVENILIAEDNEMIADLVRSLLGREGNIDVVHDGTDALERIESKYYKLIVSDINMPRMDGFTLYERCEQKYPGIGSRFLFISGNLSAEKRGYLEKRNISYLAKPMAIQELRDSAARIILSA